MTVKEFYLEWKRLKFLKTELFHKQSPIMRKVILEKDIILENLADPLFEAIKDQFFVHYKKLLEICREKNDIEYTNIIVEHLYHEIVSGNSRYNEFADLIPIEFIENRLNLSYPDFEKIQSTKITFLNREKLLNRKESFLKGLNNICVFIPFLEVPQLKLLLESFHVLNGLEFHYDQFNDLSKSELITKIKLFQGFNQFNNQNIAAAQLDLDMKWHLTEEEFEFEVESRGIEEEEEALPYFNICIEKQLSLLNEFSCPLNKHISVQLIEDLLDNQNHYKDFHFKINVFVLEDYIHKIWNGSFPDHCYSKRLGYSRFKREHMIKLKPYVLDKKDFLKTDTLRVFYMFLVLDKFNLSFSFKMSVDSMEEDELIDLIKGIEE